MAQDPTTDDISWIILVNDAGDHSLWPAGRPVPPGWRETGPEGDRETCLAWIDTHWTALQIPRARTDAA